MADRNTLMRMIFAGCKNLGMDTDTRHAWQQQNIGKSSLKSATFADLDALIKDLKAKGALKPQPRAKQPQARKIYSQWKHLHTIGGVQDPSNTALGKWLHGRYKKYRPQWLTPEQANNAIEALKKWIKRIEKEATNEQ